MIRLDEFFNWLQQPPPKKSIFQKIKECIFIFFSIVIYLITHPREWGLLAIILSIIASVFGLGFLAAKLL